MQEAILSSLRAKQTLVLTGDTGCGKSTQVPQFILDEAVVQGRGGECNIIVTEPRRLNAISLAKTVAKAREELVGQSVGYQVRLVGEICEEPGAILYCTSGVLLKKLLSNPTLEGVSHVIVDEAHERDLFTDTLMVFLKHALTLNPSLHVIVMSASMNSSLFAEYFNAPQIHVNGSLFPVKQYFLPDLLNHLAIWSDNAEKVIQNSQLDRPQFPGDLVRDVIMAIHREKPSGAILCFLPGWQEILWVAEELERCMAQENCQNYIIVEAHSRLSPAQQERVFDIPPEGIRKIILATNVAETSITISDVVYVVDAGIQKDKRYNPHNGVEEFNSFWISQGNVEQRKGRAGRIQPGESFHLYVKARFDCFEKFPIPEILKAPLDSVLLDVKNMIGESVPLREFFASALEAPPQASLERSISEMKDDGFLNEDETLTSLGCKAAKLPLLPKIAKAVLYGVMLNYMDNQSLFKIAFKTAHSFILGLNQQYDIIGVMASTEEYLEMEGLIEGPLDSMSNENTFAHCYEDLVKGALLAGLGPAHLVSMKRGVKRKGRIMLQEPSLRKGNMRVQCHSEVLIDESELQDPFILTFALEQSKERGRNVLLLRNASPITTLLYVLFSGKRLIMEEAR
ncbi:unnamed protein product [Darwinula stevensoni]|uniref:ATP-dependent RNA helicase n=1 Tax=Darwinula stevensoni TaxID=69355 RepID=A0A7R8X4U4_9CRUS|nr:unnamed protein product [Darwinula stevensoni]CAG0880087.1 unnamed protein product [Darwinula stevensoni]